MYVKLCKAGCPNLFLFSATGVSIDQNVLGKFRGNTRTDIILWYYHAWIRFKAARFKAIAALIWWNW